MVEGVDSGELTLDDGSVLVDVDGRVASGVSDDRILRESCILSLSDLRRTKSVEER